MNTLSESNLNLSHHKRREDSILKASMRMMKKMQRITIVMMKRMKKFLNKNPKIQTIVMKKMAIKRQMIKLKRKNKLTPLNLISNSYYRRIMNETMGFYRLGTYVKITMKGLVKIWIFLILEI